ncbi:MAG: VWA domain-containing protein [Bacteroidia bacterium]|nr:VWA domain-containing protein [Bacteroidia bacterium]
MKKVSFLLLLNLWFSCGYTQSGSFTLNFSGKVQAGNTPVTLDKVQIINLTRGVSTTLSNGNFNFQLSYGTGIGEESFVRNKNLVIHPAFPNPFTGTAEVVIELQNASSLRISLYEVTGMKLKELSGDFNPGMNRFTVTSSSVGLLFLQITDGQTAGSLKLVSTASSGAGKSDIVYQGNINYGTNLKVSESSNPFWFMLGDRLQLIGYSAGYANSTIYDSPVGNFSYTFSFTDPFYRLIGRNVSTETPCFVDIMFSVENLQYKGADNLSNSNFRVLEDGNVISPTETFRYIKKINTIPYKIKTVLLLDNSASVADKLDEIKKAAKALVSLITEKQEFAIFSFSENAILMQDFTSNVSLLTNAINRIITGFPTTNLYGSFIQGVNKWSEQFSTTLIEQGFLVVFTDGDDTQGSYTLQQALTARGVKKAYMIGLGSELNPGPLNQLANPGPYFPITNVSQLEPVFKQVQNDIIQYANSFYWLNYMTPKRTGLHTLRLEVLDNDNTGTDSYYVGQFNANGFKSVYSGVFVNISENNLYGLDSLLVNDANPYELRAVTYWAYEPPVYSWKSSDATLVTIENDPLYFNRAWLKFPGIKGGTAIITVNDNTNGYKKEFKVTAYTPPTVSTAPITDVGPTSATGGGNVTGNGGQPVTDRGVCWNTYGDPTIGNQHTSDGNGMGSFTSQIGGLSPSSPYFVRAYATNSIGTSYGDVVTFNTLQPGLPSVTTAAAKDTTINSALCGGEVTNDGGSAVTSRGLCWSLNPNPGLTDQVATVGSGKGTFTRTIATLTPATTYYVRAYATNSAGTAYGQEVSFTTTVRITGTLTDARDNRTYSCVKIGTQTWMSQNLAYLPAVSPSGTGSETAIHYYVYGYEGTSVSTAKTQANYTNYGVLYNWPAVLSACPTGWHLPSDAEWTVLTDYLTNNGYGYGGSGSINGKSMASTSGWTPSSTAGTVGNDQASNNSSGFTALPGGNRNNNGGFYGLGGHAYFWSSSEYGSSYAWGRYLYHSDAGLGRYGDYRSYGFSVRCLQN